MNGEHDHVMESTVRDSSMEPDKRRVDHVEATKHNSDHVQSSKHKTCDKTVAEKAHMKEHDATRDR